MQRRDLLNLGLGTAALSLAELARQRIGGGHVFAAEKDASMVPLKACTLEGDPLQVLLDGNARFAAFETRYQRDPPRLHSNVYWVNTGRITATW